ncbi:hypothetical protein L2E82_16971 [Cichorium intybus]|uniref:Uncharacterized protein n=1 Tax=Cichorium intybus TaxID=13427 RepID=A0ACB9F7Z7_CICIN|nr:hypothetical protein L2E82_16971 [Cichorium intybus]
MRVDKNFKTCNKFSLQNIQNPDSEPRMLKEHQSSSSSSSFVLFPNPNPLMRSFNIPEPIIHPPGINPYSFLNPKPHADDKLKPMTSLYVDPCTTLRTEIITNTTDLTESEHIVKDVTETKIESKTAQIIRCDVCNVICNSEAMFKDHKEGKKHLKNMQQLSVSTAIIKETPSEVANANLDQEFENKKKEKMKKKEDFFQNEPPVESLFVCNIPELNTFTEHLQCEKLETQATSGPLVQSSNSGTEKAEDELNVGTLLWCEVCEVNINSEKKLVEHNLGKKHQKNLKNSENLRTPPLTTPTASMATTPLPKPVKKTGDSEEGKPVWCEVCKIDCRGYSFSRHVRGKKHRENLRESKNITGLPSTDIDPVIIQPNDPVENPNLTEGKVVNPDEGSSTRCEVCRIRCSSIDEFNRHISGKRHEKTQKLHARVAERLLQEEGKSVILEMGKRKANGSLADEKETDAKRKKMVTEGGPSGASISCKVCNVTCNSVVEFTDHLAGQEHSAMALKQVKALIT